MSRKRALFDLAFDRRVVLVASKHGRYGWLINKVMVAGVDTNLQLAQFRLAWHFKKYEKEQAFEDPQRYAEAGLKAIARLWASGPTRTHCTVGTPPSKEGIALELSRSNWVANPAHRARVSGSSYFAPYGYKKEALAHMVSSKTAARPRTCVPMGLRPAGQKIQTEP
jgi:hypothetical protein